MQRNVALLAYALHGVLAVRKLTEERYTLRLPYDAFSFAIVSCMGTVEWYHSLNKPTWAPNENVIGTIWTILYPIIFAVNVYIFMLFIKGKIGLLIALPFWLNIFFNLIFTPIQFGLCNNWLAMIDIYLVLVTIIWAMIVIWPHAKIATLAFAPYLVWVSIATVLQTDIAFHN